MVTAAVAIAAVLGISLPANAGSPDGRIQVKVLATAVLPRGSLKEVRFATPAIAAALPVGADTRADNNYVPTIAIEYFLKPNISLETICCVTEHDIDGAGALDGAEGFVADRKIVPATLTLKYHAATGTAIKPYAGAGPAYFLMFSEKVGSTARALGATRAKVSDTAGVALQAGMDIALNDKGLGFTLDAKRYFLGDVKARWYDDNHAMVLETRHKLDPWVLSAGVAWRF